MNSLSKNSTKIITIDTTSWKSLLKYWSNLVKVMVKIGWYHTLKLWIIANIFDRPVQIVSTTMKCNSFDFVTLNGSHLTSL